MAEKGHILVVDENVDLVDTIRTLLESQGYRVSCAYEAGPARELALETRPSLVILDSAFVGPLAPKDQDMLRALQHPALRGTPVLILVGVEGALGRPGDRLAEEPYGPPRAFLQKPFRPKELLAEVKDLLVLGQAVGQEGSATVLVVDDDPDFVDVTARILRANGYGVLTAANGREALDVLHRRPVDLVLLDIMMSTVLDGLSVSEAMRADPELGQIPVIMVSSIPNTEYASAFPVGQDVHMHDWVTKPLKPEALLKKVRRHLK